MPDKVQIAIVEDDFVIAQELKVSLLELGYAVQQICTSGEALLKALENTLPDLVLLDIQIEGNYNGIQMAGILKEKHHLPFIYLTAQTDKLLMDEAIRTEPLAFLVKPFHMKELQAAIEMAIYQASKQKDQQQMNPKSGDDFAESFFFHTHLFVKVKNRLEKIQLSDILWLEAKDIYTVIKTLKTQYVVSHPLKTFENRLPADNFMRIHRSFIISLDKMEAIEDNSVCISKQFIPIGKTYKEDLLKRLRII